MKNSSNLPNFETENTLASDTGRYSKVDKKTPAPALNKAYDKTTLLPSQEQLQDITNDEEKKTLSDSESEEKELYDGEPKIVNKD
jgi:hypothetical protein